MKALLNILLAVLFTGVSFAGPPEPPGPAEPPAVISGHPDITLPEIDTSEINKLKQNLKGMNKRVAELNALLEGLSDSIDIKDLTIDNDSIIIKLSNDSIIFISPGALTDIPHDDNSLVNVGHTYTVKEGETVNGNIVNIGADVIVRGTVNGSVMAIGGNIYVTSTGYVRDGAVALSGKLKVESGGRVTNVKMAFNESRHASHSSDATVFRVMGAVFLMIFVFWLILAATFTSFMKDNVLRVMNVIKVRPWKSFLFGYLAYVLAFAAMLVLTISILGIPVALVGVPVALFAGMVLAVTSLSNLVGQKLVKAPEMSFQTFLYGTLILGGLPGLFFIIQFLSGSLTIMVFSWILIGFFVFIIVPFGLGAVLSTRFGTRTIPPPESPIEAVPRVQST
jgi:hypothetical protein